MRRTTDKSKSLKKRVLEIIEELDLYEISLILNLIMIMRACEIPLKMNYHISHIIKEAITNVIKHAKATSLKVDINGKDGLLYIEIEDDGIGFSLALNNGK
ncbi:hypothetical protein KHA80_08620 [Anaerobacillus sp. HL2]|nr:hypothetical protein KHA80_08620 [Anaerobacillus sp. HL2]